MSGKTKERKGGSKPVTSPLSDYKDHMRKRIIFECSQAVASVSGTWLPPDKQTNFLHLTGKDSHGKSLKLLCYIRSGPFANQKEIADPPPGWYCVHGIPDFIYRDSSNGADVFSIYHAHVEPLDAVDLLSMMEEDHV